MEACKKTGGSLQWKDFLERIMQQTREKQLVWRRVHGIPLSVFSGRIIFQVEGVGFTLDLRQEWLAPFLFHPGKVEYLLHIEEDGRCDMTEDSAAVKKLFNIVYDLYGK